MWHPTPCPSLGPVPHTCMTISWENDSSPRGYRVHYGVQRTSGSILPPHAGGAFYIQDSDGREDVTGDNSPGATPLRIQERAALSLSPVSAQSVSWLAMPCAPEYASTRFPGNVSAVGSRIGHVRPSPAGKEWLSVRVPHGWTSSLAFPAWSPSPLPHTLPEIGTLGCQPRSTGPITCACPRPWA